MTQIEFEQSVGKLFDKNERILVFVRIPNSGNNRHFFFINDRSDFERLLKESNQSDSITVFKSIDILGSGLVTEEFIKDSLHTISENSFKSEMIILTDSYREYKEKRYSDWQGAENKEELKEILVEYLGEYVTLLANPDFCDAKNTLHLYVPNRLGISRPGNSY